MSVYRQLAKEYAKENNIPESQVIEDIKNGSLDGVEENGYYFVRIITEKQMKENNKTSVTEVNSQPLDDKIDNHSVGTGSNEKKCPYCAEDIKNDAIFCRYCRRDLEPIDWKRQPEHDIHNTLSMKLSKKVLIIFVSAIVILSTTLVLIYKYKPGAVKLPSKSELEKKAKQDWINSYKSASDRCLKHIADRAKWNMKDGEFLWGDQKDVIVTSNLANAFGAYSKIIGICDRNGKFIKIIDRQESPDYYHFKLALSEALRTAEEGTFMINAWQELGRLEKENQYWLDKIIYKLALLFD